jgi:hypothetical protein
LNKHLIPTDAGPLIDAYREGGYRIIDLERLELWRADIERRVAIAQVRWEHGLMTRDERDALLDECAEFRGVMHAFKGESK